MLTHLEWHLGALLLEPGTDLTDALALYDRQAWAQEAALAQDQVGAVSLLARIEMAGGDGGRAVAAPWGGPWRLAPRTPTSPFWRCSIFTVWTRAGLGPIGSGASCRPLAIKRCAGSRIQVWRDRGGCRSPEGLRRSTAGASSPRQAPAPSSRSPRQLEALGGSHAQRDLFDLIALDAFSPIRRSGRSGQSVWRIVASSTRTVR